MFIYVHNVKQQQANPFGVICLECSPGKDWLFSIHLRKGNLLGLSQDKWVLCLRIPGNLFTHAGSMLHWHIHIFFNPEKMQHWRDWINLLKSGSAVSLWCIIESIVLQDPGGTAGDCCRIQQEQKGHWSLQKRWIEGNHLVAKKE